MASRKRAIAGVTSMAVLAAGCATSPTIDVRSASPLAESESPGPAVGGPADSAPPPAPGTTAPPTPPTTPSPSTTEAPVPTTTMPPTEPTEPAIVEPELLTSIPIGEVIDIGSSKPERAHDEFVAVAFTDIERWWGEVFDDVYEAEFEPLQGGIYAGYPERTEAIPGCNEPETNYLDLQLYVAFYCNFGDFMAYDDGADPDPEFGSLLTPLANEFGPAVIGVVLAHEYGHVVQERIGVLDRPLATIVTEQQADCFAGAWTGQAYRGESPLLRLGDGDVRAGLLAMLEVRDPVGTNQFAPGGHGSAFDRVGAFQVGFVNGPGRCSELLDTPLPLMPNEFRSAEDFDRGGNASYDCSDDPDPECTPATDFLAEDVNHFWQVEFEGEWQPFTVAVTKSLGTNPCESAAVLTPQVAVCPAERSIVYDEPAVLGLYDDFGDFTLGYTLGIAAAELAQREMDSQLAGEPRALLNDCFTGAWVRDITPDENGVTPRSADLDNDGEPDSTVVSSPGDLDEAIRMAILLGDDGANVDAVGSAFEKIDAFRTGVLGGLEACRDAMS